VVVLFYMIADYCSSLLTHSFQCYEGLQNFAKVICGLMYEDWKSRTTQLHAKMIQSLQNNVVLETQYLLKRSICC